MDPLVFFLVLPHQNMYHNLSMLVSNVALSCLFFALQVFMLNVIGILNSDHTNIVTFFERFEYMGQICLAFEMLDGHLYQLLEQRGWKPMAINEIRPIAKQACSCDQCIMESIIFCSAYLILVSEEIPKPNLTPFCLRCPCSCWGPWML